MEDHPSLTPEEILAHFRTHEEGAPFPREAVEAALAQKEEITPLLLNGLDEAADDVPSIDEDDMLHFYAMYLLAQFREARALPLLTKFFSWPEDFVDAVTGDISDDLDRLLASVCGNDFSEIAALAENDDAGEFVRGAALNSLAVMVAHGLLPREKVVAYYRTVFDNLEKEPSYVWDSLVIACTNVHPGDLMTEIKRAEAAELLDPYMIEIESIQEICEQTIEEVLTETRENRPIPIDAIDSLSAWYCFSAEAAEAEDEDD